MEREHPKPEARQVTLVEQIRNHGDRMDKALEREQEILDRLRRLEERVDSILGSEPREAEPGVKVYDNR